MEISNVAYRARAAKTGESYTAALSNVDKPSPSPESDQDDIKSVRVGGGTNDIYNDPRNIHELRAADWEFRSLMREHIGPGRELYTSLRAQRVRPTQTYNVRERAKRNRFSDWSRFEWDDLSEELDAISKLARNFGYGR